MRRNVCLTLLLSGLLVRAQSTSTPAASSPRAQQQPIYIFVTANVSDYVNWAITEERIQRTLGALEKYRADDPSLTATVYFSGAISNALAQRNSHDHLLDLLRSDIKKGLIQPGYDGSDEPTYEHRPLLDFGQAKTAEERWLVRTESAKQLLTQSRDPMTGAPQPERSGGLKRMQEVFGPAAIIRGVVLQAANLWGPMNEVGGDAEIVNVIRQLNTTAIMVGLADSDVGKVESQYRPWANVFSKAISPDPNTSPEVYWEEDVLRLAETSGLDLHTFRAEDGVEKLKALVAGMDRSHVRVLHIDLSNQRSYLKPPTPAKPRPVMPLSWAWQHPDNPLFPEDMRQPESQVAAHYAQQEEVLKFVASQLVPANPGSRFLSSSDLKQVVEQGWGYDLPFGTLRGSVEAMLKTWGDQTTPPPFLKVDDHYLSLADLFLVLSDALAEQNRTGHFPASVHVGRVFGPILTAQPRPPVEGQVTAASIARTCSKIAATLHDNSWSVRPHNAIPSPVEIESFSVTPAQFLRLMAEAISAPGPATRLTIKPVEMFASRVFTYYTRRPHTDLGAPWTYKPAVLETDSLSR